MTVLATFISLTIPSAAGAENSAPRLDSSSTLREDVARSVTLAGRGAERCPSHRRGVAFYIGTTNHWLGKRGVRFLAASPSSTSCRYTLWLAHRWKARSWQARQAYERFQERRYDRMRNDPESAIRYVFGSYAGQALAVASCESGWRTWAENGQYLGMFQMGSSERAIYGHGSTPLEQARAAYRYFVASGRDWSPWSCKPW